MLLKVFSHYKCTFWISRVCGSFHSACVNISSFPLLAVNAWPQRTQQHCCWVVVVVVAVAQSSLHTFKENKIISWATLWSQEFFLLCKINPQINLVCCLLRVSGQMKSGKGGSIVSTNPSAECQRSLDHLRKTPKTHQNSLYFSLCLCCCRDLSHLARADR